MVPKHFSCLIFVLCSCREDPPTHSQPDSDDEAEEIQVCSKNKIHSIDSCNLNEPWYGSDIYILAYIW